MSGLFFKNEQNSEKKNKLRQFSGFVFAPITAGCELVTTSSYDIEVDGRLPFYESAEFEILPRGGYEEKAPGHLCFSLFVEIDAVFLL